MPNRKNSLTPREVAFRLLENMDEEATFAEIIRQLRILQEIDESMGGAVGVGRSEGGPAARSVVDSIGDAVSDAAASSDAGDGASSTPLELDADRKRRIDSVAKWRRLADEDGLDSFLRRTDWDT